MTPEELNRRFDHHPPTGLKVGAHEAMRRACKELAQIIDEELPEGREKSLAMTNLEQTAFWSNAAIAREGN